MKCLWSCRRCLLPKGLSCPVLVEDHQGAHPAEAIACQPANQRGPLLDSTKRERCLWRALRFVRLPELLAGLRADCRWFSQPDARRALCPLREYRLLRNRRADRLDRRLIDVIVRQTQPAPVVLLRNKKSRPYAQHNAGTSLKTECPLSPV